MAEDAVIDGTPARAAHLNPYAGALFSLLWPGVGQLYCGRWQRAVAFMLGIPLLAAVTGGWLVTVPVRVLNLLPMLVPVALQVVALVDAAKGARLTPAGKRPWYSHWLGCAALSVINVFAWAPAQVAVVRNALAQAFVIPAGGMEPTILVGDRILVNRFAYGLHSPLSGRLLVRRGEPRRGDLVAFLFPEDRTRVFLKRVIGLPGESVEVRGKTVVIDGRPLEEPYARFIDAPPRRDGPGPGPHAESDRGTWGPETVPAQMLFVLGDNRDSSRDSRYWGFVPVEDVLGQASVIYLSVEHARGQPARVLPWTVRWRRLGQVLH